ncbi:MAG: isopentenyl transferase family protein [Actinomycetota bacterium]|nr:isopentenyl transferase family protein [Actinomycetota bacterium]
MIYFITGTTASGKTALAHKLALENNMKIISLDSMAVYQGIDILSDKPDRKMQQEVQYFGIDIVTQDVNFSVFDYIKYLADMNLDKASYEEDIIAVGGTGLYFNAIVNSYKLKKTNKEYREYLETLPLKDLKEMYLRKFPKGKGIDTNNKRRLIRILESNNEEALEEIINFDIPKEKIGIFWDNPDIKEKISYRTHKMINIGLIEEVSSLINPSRTIQQAIGYTEALSGKNEEEIINNINLKTLRLVKKQKTWFKKIDNILYIESNDSASVEKNMKDIIHGKY